MACPNLYIRIFMAPTQQILEMTPAIIRTYALSFLLLPVNIFSTYYFQAIMRPKAAFIVSAARGLVISGALINNAMYIIIAIAVIFIAIKVPAFVRLPSIINIISLTAAKLPIALGIGGAIVLTGTDISAGRCVGLTACIAASLLQVASYSNKMFPNLGVMPLWLVFLIVVAVGALV